jgi:hypothetical protein
MTKGITVVLHRLVKICTLSTTPLPKASFLTIFKRLQDNSGQNFHFEHQMLAESVFFVQIRKYVVTPELQGGVLIYNLK